MKIELSLILACYNEGPTLAGSLARILVSANRLRVPYEIIAIDDASRDRTPEILQSLAKRPDIRVRYVRHRRNRGRGATVSEGLAMAEGRVVGYMDVDLEVGPEYIPVFYDTIREGADVATGRRIYMVGPWDVHRYLLSRGYGRLIRFRLGLQFADTEAGFKFFTIDSAQALAAETCEPGWFWDTEVLAVAHRKGLRIVEVPCLFVRRRDKRSTVRLIRDSIEYLRALRRFEAR